MPEHDLLLRRLLLRRLLLRRLCCDMANDAACLLRGDLTPETVAHRLMGYAQEITQQVEGFDGPATLKSYLEAGGEEAIGRTRRQPL